MRWIIEAGTTKTDSVVIGTSGIEHRGVTSGLNPVSDSQYIQKLADLCTLHDVSKVTEVYYYGSGCISAQYNDPIAREISKHVHPRAQVTIADDLLGAAISTCGDKSGIIVILGTGSNIGYYDGHVIADRIPSCGYLLGDEGGGYKIGQAIYLRYCRGLLSEDEEQLISRGDHISRKEAVSILYQHDNHRQYLASYSRYITALDEVTQDIILKEIFDPLMHNLILPMWGRYRIPISMVGSISHHFSDRLMSMFDNFNIIAGSIVQSPIEGLLKYHAYE